MNSFEKIIFKMQAIMIEPKAFGWFHLLWIMITIAILLFLYSQRKRYNEKQLKIVLGIYGFGSLFLEIIKQIIWSFEWNQSLMIGTWNYPWYIFPFQLCSTPIYVSIICLFLKNNGLRKSLLSYLSYITIWGSIMTIIMPDSCFVETILVNIHTMYLHCGSFVVSIYLLMTKEVKIAYKNVLRALITFLIFVLIALTMNVIFYNLVIPVSESFNMFYISPYIVNELPILSTVQSNYPYVVYILFYVLAFFIGCNVIYGIGKIFQRKR